MTDEFEGGEQPSKNPADVDISKVVMQDYNGDESSVKDILNGLKQGEPKTESKGSEKDMEIKNFISG